MAGRKARSWAMTYNIPDGDEPEVTRARLQALCDQEERIIRYVLGLERGEQEQRDHIQGFIRLNNNYQASALKAMLPGFESVHLEICRKPDEANIRYCLKDGNAVEKDKTHQGARTDIQKAVECKTINEVAKRFPDVYLKHAKGFEALFARKREIDFIKKTNNSLLGRTKPEVVWLCGNTGTGKTYYVASRESATDLWCRAICGSSWFDGYEGHPAALFDDFRPDQIPFADLLRILDGYRYRVPIKGGFVWWEPERVYITTPFDIEETFRHVRNRDGVPLSREDLDQIKRRVNKQILFVRGREPEETYPGR